MFFTQVAEALSAWRLELPSSAVDAVIAALRSHNTAPRSPLVPVVGAAREGPFGPEFWRRCGSMPWPMWTGVVVV